MAMKGSNPTLLSIVDCGQQANGTAGPHTPTHGFCSYLHVDDMLPPPAEDMLDNIWEESDDDSETWRPYPRSVPMMNRDFQKFEPKLQKRILRQQPDFEVMRNRALGLVAGY